MSFHKKISITKPTTTTFSIFRNQYYTTQKNRSGLKPPKPTTTATKHKLKIETLTHSSFCNRPWMGHCIFYSKIESIYLSIYLSIYTYGYIEREGEGMLPGTGERWWPIGGAVVVSGALGRGSDGCGQSSLCLSRSLSLSSGPEQLGVNWNRFQNFSFYVFFFFLQNDAILENR